MPPLEQSLASILARPTAHCALGADPANPAKGLAQLVLTLLKLIHELLERQAIRRMESGTLEAGELDRVGSALQAQHTELLKLAASFDLRESDLRLDLGPLGRI